MTTSERPTSEALPETQGPYEARLCKGIPTDCCDYGVISLSEGREVCRVWREQDARAIAAALASAPASPAIGIQAVTDEMVAGLMENIWKQIGRPDLVYDPRAKTEYRFNGVDMRAALEAALHPAPEAVSDGVREAAKEALRVLCQTPDSRRSNAHKNAIGKLRAALSQEHAPGRKESQ